MKNLVWLALAACLLGAGACSSDGSDSSARSPEATSSPLSVPTPTSNVHVKKADPAWSIEDAVDGYREAMRPVTAQLTKLSTMPPDATLSRTRKALRAYSSASTGAVEELLKGRWDDDLRPSVDTLIAALLDQQKYFDGLAAGDDVAAIQAQGDKTAQTLLVSRVCAAALENRLGIGDGLLDLATPTS